MKDLSMSVEPLVKDIKAVNASKGCLYLLALTISLLNWSVISLLKLSIYYAHLSLEVNIMLI